MAPRLLRARYACKCIRVHSFDQNDQLLCHLSDMQLLGGPSASTSLADPTMNVVPTSGIIFQCDHF